MKFVVVLLPNRQSVANISDHHRQIESMSTTSLSLLSRLNSLDNAEAWDDFVECYGPNIFRWCRRFGLQDSDAADVTQEVLTRTMKAMKSFEYDSARGRFRGWLTTVTNRAIADFVKKAQRAGRGSGDPKIHQALLAIQAPDALDELAAAIEAEAERELMREAEECVRLRVAARTWDAYRLTAIESVTAADDAVETGLRVAEVYVAKSRVLKMIREEVKALRAFDE